jgi:putative two-component system response regulator
MTATKRDKIILVDDNAATLVMGKNMLKEHYDIFPVPSAERMFTLLKQLIPDLILLDVEMPDVNGYDAVRILKSERRWMDIPVIFLTAKTDEGSELEGLTLGAIDYVAKPFSAPLLLKRIENHLLIASQRKELRYYNEKLVHMVAEKTRQIAELQNAILSTVAEMVEFRDDLTGGHISRTQRYLQLLLEKLLEEKVYRNETLTWDPDFLLPSAQLHDVGKIAISDTILNKPGRLTPEEFEEMKRHVTIGVEAIERIEKNTMERDFLRHAKIIAGTHHEKWDGSGYPHGLVGQGIPLQGRLMAIADVYDALTSERPYKKPFSTEEAQRIIDSGSATHFDPILVDIFDQVSGQFAQIARAR